MSLPWLKDDYEKKPAAVKSESRSRSRSGSRSRQKSEDRKSNSNSRRSRSPRNNNYNRDWSSSRGRGRGRGGRGGGPPDKHFDRKPKRRHSSSSSASSRDSSKSTTRPVASTKPKYLNARIFVANIASKDMTKGEILTHFGKYGTVIDCLIHPKNYIFVQYMKEDEARLAVEGENGNTFSGFRINVKMANDKFKNNSKKRDYNKDGGDRGPGGPRDNRDRFGPDPFSRDRHGHGPPPGPRPPGGPRFPPGEFDMRDPFYPPDPFRRGFPPRDPWAGPDDPFRRDPFDDPFRDPYAAPRGPLPPPAAAVPDGPIECEVFIVNSQLRNYGELIERKVKDQSVITSLSLLPEGRTAPQMVEELTVKGALFAIFLNAQNEMHRSLTLNILHGTPQEHRNMPMEDAISLIGRSFEKYVEELRAKANASTTSAPSTSTSSAVPSRVFLPPSSEVSYLLNLLADNRAVTVTELTTIIDYLTERRDKLVDADNRPPAGEESKLKEKAVKKEDEVKATHDELTKKILSIFKGVESGKSATPQPPPPPSVSTSGGGASNLINFDNPNVQQALNNLIQSGPELLKSFTPSSSGIPSSSMTPVSGIGMGINSAPATMDPTMVSSGMGMMGPDMATMAGMGMGYPGPEMGMYQDMTAYNMAAMAAYSMGGMNPNMNPNFNNFEGGGGVPGVPAPPPPPPPNQRF